MDIVKKKMNIKCAFKWAKIIVCLFALIPEVSTAQVLLAKKAENGKLGYYATNGTCVIPAVYDDAGNFSADAMATWVKKDGLYYFIDRNNLTLYGKGFMDISRDGFNYQVAVVKEQGDSLWYVMDYSGHRISPKYEVIKRGGPYGFIVKEASTGKFRFVDFSFEPYFENQYDNLNILNKHVLAYEEDGKNGLMNFRGDIIYKAVFRDFCIEYGYPNYWTEICNKDGVHKDCTGFYIAQNCSGKWGVIDDIGFPRIEFKYKTLEDLKKKIRKSKKTFSPYMTMKSRYFHADNEATKEIYGKSSYVKRYTKAYLDAANEIETRNYQIIASTLPNGLPQRQKVIPSKGNDGKYFFCSNDGSKSQDAGYYDEILEFPNCYVVKAGNYYGMVGIYGNMVLPAKYARIELFHEGNKDLFVVEDAQKKGVVTSNGVFKQPIEYDEILYTPQGFAITCRNNKWGLLGKDGSVINKRQYDYLSAGNGKIVAEISAPNAMYNTELDIATGSEKEDIVGKIFNDAYNSDDIQMQYEMYLFILSLDPHNSSRYNASVYNNLGVIFRNQGDDDQALAYYNKCLAIDPDNQTAKSNVKTIKSERRAEKMNSFANALGQVASMIGNANVQQNGGSYNSSYQNTESSSGGTQTRSRVARNCTHCAGTGECKTCRGNGRILGKIDQEWRPCPSCNPGGKASKEKRGKCTFCNGTGKR